MSTEFIDGFKVYKNIEDLDFINLLNIMVGENLLIEDSDGLRRKYNIRVNYKLLTEQIMQMFCSYGVRLENSVMNTEKDKEGSKFGKVTLWISVPEENEELNISGKELAKWFTWEMATLKMLHVDGGSGLKYLSGVDNMGSMDSMGSENDMSVSDRIKLMSGFSAKEVKENIEVKSKIRNGEIWRSEDKEQYLVGKQIIDGCRDRITQGLGNLVESNSKVKELMKEVYEYGVWLKNMGFKLNVFELGNIGNVVEDMESRMGMESGMENGEVGGNENEEDKGNNIENTLKRYGGVSDEVIQGWNEKDKEKFKMICRRMEEIGKELMEMGL